MPANAVHTLFADALLADIRQLYPELNLEALYYGTQGPDIFFFHRILPWMPGKSLNKIGSRLHKIPPAQIFGEFKAYLLSNTEASSVCTSYVYGFLLHFVLDRNAHTYISSAVQDIMKKENIRYSQSIIHNRIETNLDVIFINELLRIPPSQYHPWEFLTTDEAVLTPVADMLAFLLKQALHLTVTQKQMRLALADTPAVLRLLTDESGRKGAALGVAEKLLPYKMPAVTSMIRKNEPDGMWDYANTAHSEWTRLSDKSVRTDSFYDILEASKNEALEMIFRFSSLNTADAALIKEIVGTRNFSGSPTE